MKLFRVETIGFEIEYILASSWKAVVERADDRHWNLLEIQELSPLIADKLDSQLLKDVEAFLRVLQEAGGWYRSAIELYVNGGSSEPSYDGEELKVELDNLLLRLEAGG